jgi:tungstate transport system substrate-binding protein
MRMGERGDADVLLVHHRPSEVRFVAEGHGVQRHDVMTNDFILVGPRADPARIRGLKDAAEALRRIADSRSPFASRGDNSGTHLAEQGMWRAAGIDPTLASGQWYRETGSGMGATLNTAVAMNAYTLADRGTWLAFRNRGGLVVLTEGDPRLFNPYSVILVNPKRHPHVKAAAGQTFIDWLTGPEGQRLIGEFRVHGEPVFFPNSDPFPNGDGAVQPPAAE